MIFNFSKKSQFATRILLENENLETVTSTKLLGTVITSDLKWTENTSYLVKKANARMQLLRSVATFSTNKEDLKIIYTLFIRSMLELNSNVWHSALTQENTQDLERVQKTAFKIILREKYVSYENAQAVLKLKALSEKRNDLALAFAQKCSANPNTEKMFPLKIKRLNNITRNIEKYQTTKAKTERLKMFSIPHMQKLLNKNEVLKEKYNK